METRAAALSIDRELNVGVIDVEGLHKTFSVRTKTGVIRRTRKLVHAVSDIDLRVDAGEMVGYIGPNGAGKSTTIKMLTGILAPSSGRVQVLGLEPVGRRVELARRIGVVFGQRTQLWWDLPLEASFELLRRVYRVDRRRHSDKLDMFVEMLDLGAFLTTPVRQLSLGQRMRGELTAAFLHDPEIVFLDEPTIGLDVVSKHAVRSFLSETAGSATVILTTHDLADIEHLCRRMVIVDHGRIVYDGDLDTFRARHGRRRTVIVDLEQEGPHLDVALAEVVKIEGARQWLQFDRAQTTAAEVVARVVEQRAIRDISVEEPAIEELVRNLYKPT